MYFFVLFGALFLTIFDSNLNADPPNFKINADSAVVMSPITGRVLYVKNGSKRQYPASVTKIAVCIYAIEQGMHLLDTKIVARAESLRSVSAAQKIEQNYRKYPSYWLETAVTSHIGIKVGEEIPFRDLLHGLMLASGGDAANVIADYFGDGSIQVFMDRLNQFLQSIGCKDTHFCNPSGLHHPDHYSTAMDVACFTSYAMKNPLFKEIVAKTQYEKAATNKQPATTLIQGNRLLKRGSAYYPYAIGIKTGWHSIAQSNLAAAAEKDGRLLIAVLLHTPTRQEMFLDAKKIFEQFFTEKKISKQLLPAGQQSFSRNVTGSPTVLTTYSKDALSYSYYPSEEPQISCQLIWNKVELPIEPSTQVAEVRLLADNQVIAKTTLYAENLVEKSWMVALYDQCMKIVQRPVSLIAFIGIAVLLFGMLFTNIRARKPRSS